MYIVCSAYICVLYYGAHKPLHICRDVCLYVVYLLMFMFIYSAHVSVYIYINGYYVLGIYMCVFVMVPIYMWACMYAVHLCPCVYVVVCLHGCICMIHVCM